MKYFSFIVLLLLTLNACQNKPSTYQHSSLNFGTLIDITLYDVDENTAQQAFNDLDTDFKQLHVSWSPWVAGSLMRMNNLLPTGGFFSADPSILELIQASIPLSEATQQLYNPAIGKLINLWQFHKSDEADIQPPAADKIAALVKQNPTLNDLDINGFRIRSRNPALQLNFGAFAKGVAIDIGIKHLQTLGIQNAILNAGGDLKVIGQRGDRPWRIAIRHPRQDGMLASLDAYDGEAVFTSGDYERFYHYQGKRYHHILDPRSGYPANASQSVTVIHHNAGVADAAATALFIAGAEGWYNIAKALGLKYVMLIDNKGNIIVSPSMKKRLTFMQTTPTLIVSPPL